MRRVLVACGVAAGAALSLAVPVSATIHPIVESFDCANEQAFEHHPLGDPADPIGQTPGEGSHSDQSTLRAVQEADGSAFSDHKLDGECGRAGQ